MILQRFSHGTLESQAKAYRPGRSARTAHTTTGKYRKRIHDVRIDSVGSMSGDQYFMYSNSPVNRQRIRTYVVYTFIQKFAFSSVVVRSLNDRPLSVEK